MHTVVFPLGNVSPGWWEVLLFQQQVILTLDSSHHPHSRLRVPQSPPDLKDMDGGSAQLKGTQA